VCVCQGHRRGAGRRFLVGTVARCAWGSRVSGRARGTGRARARYARCLGPARAPGPPALLWGAWPGHCPPGVTLYSAEVVSLHASRLEVVRACQRDALTLGARTQALPAVWWTPARSRPSRGGVRVCRCADVGSRHSACRRHGARSCLTWSWRDCAYPLGVRHPQTPARPKRIVVRVVFYWGLCAAAGGPRWRPLPQDGLLGRSMGGFSSGDEPWQPQAAAACRDIFFAPGKRNVMPAGQRQGAPHAAHTPPLHAMGPPLAITFSTGIGRSAGRSKKK